MLPTSAVLSLDIMRDTMLNANDRLHWAAKNRRTDRLRQMAGWHGKAWRGRHKLTEPLPFKVRAVAALAFPTNRHRDEANYQALLKPLIDGLIDAKVLAGDDARHLEGPSIRFEGECRQPFACHIDVRLERA